MTASSRSHTAGCVCGEINTRHCPVHGQGEVVSPSRSHTDTREWAEHEKALGFEGCCLSAIDAGLTYERLLALLADLQRLEALESEVTALRDRLGQFVLGGEGMMSLPDVLDELCRMLAALRREKQVKAGAEGSEDA